jgi:hypothetical protein
MPFEPLLRQTFLPQTLAPRFRPSSHGNALGPVNTKGAYANAAGFLEAEKSFRRVRGHAQIKTLIKTLRPSKFELKAA